MDPPHVPSDRLAGWRRVTTTEERPFSAGPVTVTAETVRYERVTSDEPADADARTTSDGLRPFFFASHLRIRPPTSPNPPLTRLVEHRARDGFRERLADNAIEDVTHRENREIVVDDPAASPATLSTFRGRCRVEADSGVGERVVPVEALLAVWSVEEYLLAGGAYPIDESPDHARRDLLRLIRGVRPTG
ncbi:DUF6517 family protein [Halorubrum luteum]